MARSHSARLRSCISTPLQLGSELVGVLSLYSDQSNAFTDDHRRIIETVARQVANTFKSLEFENQPRRDTLTGLPCLHQLEPLIRSAVSSPSKAISNTYALLFLDVVNLKQINAVHGRAAGDEVLRHVVHHAQHELRVADVLFRNASDEFIAFLNATDSQTATLAANRIRERITAHALQLASGSWLTVETTVTCVCAPNDGESLADLLALARRSTMPPAPDAPGVH